VPFIANLPPLDMDLGYYTSSWCGRHYSQVILKSFNAWQCYSLESKVYLQTHLIRISTFKPLDRTW
jgi:hypothetical protein